ncbi:hypothetical protein F4677DRAFT_442129 [Hypoxylon crocopeplum]|nr:hypothetical protein F4677DRAFT_442129 [Hypoxylon crocopeplum]
MLFMSLLLLPLSALTARHTTFVVAGGTPDMLPAISPLFSFNTTVEWGLSRHLPYVQNHLAVLKAGVMPLSCIKEARDFNLDPSDFEVYKVTYRDCDRPWYFCRHKSAKIDGRNMRIAFGRFPVAMRELVKHIIVLKGSDMPGLAGKNILDTIVIADNYFKLYIFAHEIAHSIDRHIPVPGVNLTFQGGLSLSPKWQDEVNKDKATPTEYARRNWSENLAEAGVVALFDMVVPGGLKTVNANYRDYETFRAYYGDIIQPRKKLKCTNRVPDSPLVNLNDMSNVVTPADDTKLGVDITMDSGEDFENATYVLPVSL